jgi:hypothetical protein
MTNLPLPSIYLEINGQLGCTCQHVVGQKRPTYRRRSPHPILVKELILPNGLALDGSSRSFLSRSSRWHSSSCGQDGPRSVSAAPACQVGARRMPAADRRPVGQFAGQTRSGRHICKGHRPDQRASFGGGRRSNISSGILSAGLAGERGPLACTPHLRKPPKSRHWRAPIFGMGRGGVRCIQISFKPR